MNKNGDLKIDRRKCRLYKKEDLAKKFKLGARVPRHQKSAIGRSDASRG